MEAKEKEILNEVISGTKCQFVIPVFQRNYDWREKDCQRLFNDILEVCDDIKNPDRKHFIGAFVYRFNKLVETSFNEYILIDGQQRLTSMTLLLKALHDRFKSLGTYEDRVSEIYETYLINKFAKNEYYRLKLKPNKKDNINFNLLMNDEYEEIDKSSNIYRNYQYFSNALANMTQDIEVFYHAMERVEGVSVVLDEKDNPQVIFESLNSTGLDLSDIDLIRNYLLMNVDAEKQEILYQNYWIKMEQLLKDDFTQFIRDYLSMHNGIVTPSGKNKIYTSFQKFYTKKSISIDEFLEDLLDVAKIYSRLLIRTFDDSPLSSAINDYISLDMKTTYPFLLGLLIENDKNYHGKQNITDTEMVEIVQLLESYIIRRNVCNLAGGGLSQVMSQLYINLKEKFGDDFYTDTYQKIAMYLAGVTTKAYLPKDDEFSRELTERDMYKNRNIRFILEKIEKYKQSKEIIDLSSLSIEHIMPQNLTPQWHADLNEKDVDAFHEKYKNNIGNLTLTAYNSEMSNKSFDEKKQHIDFSRLAINQSIKNYTAWNKDTIIDRTKELNKLALSIWSYPKITKIESISSIELPVFEDEDFDFTGTRPKGYKLRDYKRLTNTWTDLYLSILDHLYELSPEVFLSLFSENGYSNSEKPLISKDKFELRYSEKFHEGYYIETNFNTERKIQILKTLLKDFDFEPDEVIFYIE